MANNYNIPEWLENKVRLRDTNCVYCDIKMQSHIHAKGTPADKATFEHIDNDGPPTEENIALCCAACNASKGTKNLSDWIGSPYCLKKNINNQTVAEIIKKYLKTFNPETAKKIRARWDREVAEALKNGKSYTSTREMLDDIMR